MLNHLKVGTLVVVTVVMVVVTGVCLGLGAGKLMDYLMPFIL